MRIHPLLRAASAVLVAGLLSLIGVPAVFAGAQGEYEHRGRFPVPADKPVWIESALAEIVIEPTRGGQIEAQVTASERIVDQIQPVVAGREESDGLHLRILAGPDAPAAAGQGGATSLSRAPDDYLILTVHVPAGTHLVLGLGTGDARVSGFAGRLVISAGQGNVVMDNVSGQITVTTTTGDIRATGLKLTGRSRMVTSAGSIDLQIDSGTDHLAEASSADGQVRIR